MTLLPAVMAALVGTEHQHLCPDVTQTKHLQDLQLVLEPFEKATKMLSSSKKPTASFILPNLHRLIHVDCKVSDEDSLLISKAKKAIGTDLKKRCIIKKS